MICRSQKKNYGESIICVEEQHSKSGLGNSPLRCDPDVTWDEKAQIIQNRLPNGTWL